MAAEDKKKQEKEEPIERKVLVEKIEELVDTNVIILAHF